MKKIFISLLLYMLWCNVNYSQVDITASMGINFVNNTSLQDYVNTLLSAEELGTFNSAFEFHLETDYSLAEKFQFGMEYVYMIFSHNSSFTGGVIYDISYIHHKPSLIAYYVISGKGYKFKFGGGAGIRIIDLDEKIQITKNYTSVGFGILLKAQAHTSLGDNLYANIAGNIRYDIAGEPKDADDNYFRYNFSDEKVNINSLSFGLNLGLSFFF